MHASDRLGRYFSDFQRIGKKQKVIILALLVTLFVGSILGSRMYFSYQLIPSTQRFTPSPIPLPATVSLTANKKQLSRGENLTVMVKINSPNQGIEAADFVVTFDPNYLKVATISSGNYFKTYTVQHIEKDFVKFAGSASLSENKLFIPKGEGTIGVILFDARAATSTSEIAFDRTKTILGSGGKNILDVSKISNLKITIQ